MDKSMMRGLLTRYVGEAILSSIQYSALNVIASEAKRSNLDPPQFSLVLVIIIEAAFRNRPFETALECK
jgi:hypothetical protein